MNRFHPALVILHWVIALLVIFSLIWGRFWVGHLSDDIDNKATIIKIHIGAGFTIFI
jgi:cytochrome b561